MVEKSLIFRALPVKTILCFNACFELRNKVFNEFQSIWNFELFYRLPVFDSSFLRIRDKSGLRANFCMQNKLFHGLIATFVLITVSIPDIALAYDPKPPRSSELSEETRTILERDCLNDDQRQEIREDIQASEREYCLGMETQIFLEDKSCPNEKIKGCSEVQTSSHQGGNIRNIIDFPVRIIDIKNVPGDAFSSLMKYITGPVPPPNRSRVSNRFKLRPK